MQIRPMKLTDYEHVFALWSNTDGIGVNPQDDTFESISRFLDRNPTTCFVAEEGDDIAGVILCGYDGRRAYIYHLAVSTAHRKKGIGRALVERVFEALSDIGVLKVGLNVIATNDAANAFWQSLGFARRSDVCFRNRFLDGSPIQFYN